MKLTKKLEAEILHLYKNYWDAYLKGDMKTFASALDANCQIIGSAAGEVFDNKKSAVKYYSATAGQITGKADFRKRKFKLTPVEKNVLVVEESDFVVLADNTWTFYGAVRISTLFHKKAGKWKIIQQHGSIPDTLTEKGEQVNTDKIKAENRKLKTAVEKRTIELENKNRELEIETALEKVRAIALTMKVTADMPQVCRVIATQLEKLGVQEIRNVQTAVFYEDGGTYMNYEYYAKHNKTFITETSYTNHAIHRAFANKMLKGKGGFITTHISKAELPGWIAYQKTTNVFIDTYLEKATSLNYYWYALGPVALGISTYEPLNKKEIALFKRFRNVFELAYRRFLDIELAMAQAKEARIETALERVRAIAMAMRKPEELAGIGETLFTELKALGFIDLRNAEIIINNDERETVTSYYYSDYGITGILEMEYRTNPILQKWIDEMKKADDAFAEIIIPENEMEAWRKYREAIGYVPDPKLNEAKIVYYYSYSIGLGALSISSFKPVSAEQIKTLERFRNVFNLSYQRYIDIAQAEAQAKEAQVQLALERVRARTMAMQHSNELSEAAYILFQQFKELGENPDQATIGVINEEEHVIEYWVTLYGNQINRVFKFSIDEPQVTNKIYNAWKEHKSSLVIDLSGKELLEFTTYRESMGGAKYNPEEKRRIINVAFFSKGLLNVQSNKTRSEESINLLERFALVFEQTYTRFLDLQKAEAQAREAEIELALERVRAKAMAMYKSQDLSETILTVFEELEKLSLNILRCGIGIIDKETSTGDIWTTVKQGQKSVIQVSSKEKFDQHPLSKKIFEAWLKQEDFSYLLVGEDLDAYYNSVAETNLDTPETRLLVQSTNERKQYFYTPTFKAGNLYVFSEKPFPDDDKKVIKRFASVLNLTFNRFLDLQKAEVQTREAQIETALEKVRSSSLAMHKTDELQEVVIVVFEKLKELGVGLNAAGAIIATFVEGSRDVVHWLAAPDFSLATRNEFPYFEHIINIDEWKSKESGETFFSKTYSFEETHSFHKYLFEHTGYKLLPDEVKNWVLAAENYTNTIAFQKHSAIVLYSFNNISPSEKEIETLKRFSKVFEQAYTRFLDLQKAEVQTREAQIENALEKVRSRSLAMHKSDELQEVVNTVFDRLQDLEIETDASAICVCNNEDSNGYMQWIQNAERNYSSCIYTPYDEQNKVGLDIIDSLKNKKELVTGTYTKEEKNKWFRHMFTDSDLKHLPDSRKEFILSAESMSGSTAAAKNTGISLLRHSDKSFSENENEILKRFAKVFEQAYTRFLDLQKAEVQTREAQIEAALERVRIVALSMKKPVDLLSICEMLFKQLSNLGLDRLRNAMINIYDDNKSMLLNYDFSGDIGTSITSFSYTGFPLIENITKQIRGSNEAFVEIELTGNELNDWKTFRTKNGERDDPELEKTSRLYYYFYSIGIGAIGVSTFHSIDDEKRNILKRFRNVFDFAYKRYMDLAQAEAQAREAQIEAALERVRARTMAMHKSDELAETAAILIKQLNLLGIEPISLYIGLCKVNDGDIEIWSTDEDGKEIDSRYVANIKSNPSIKKIYDAWTEKKKFIIIDMQGKELEDWIAYWRKEHHLYFKPESFLHRRVQNIVYFPNGFIAFTSPDEQPGEPIQLLERFAAVFNLTYTRFLDLQKAEAQAREAQTEAALEKVRSRSLAMQKSDELKEVIRVVYDQFVHLNIPVEHTGFIINYKENNDMHIWLADQRSVPSEVVIPYFDSPHWNSFIDAKRTGSDFFTNHFTFGEKNKFYKELFTLIPNVPDEVINYYLNCAGLAISTVLLDNVGLYIENFAGTTYSDEENKILMRFGKVFQQTYTRFLDLQTAEAQAKESQIQLALERVRARTMAMQHSDELAETVSVVFKQLLSLGIQKEQMRTCAIVTLKKDNPVGECWITNPDGNVIQQSFMVPYDEGSAYKPIYDAWKQEEKIFVVHLAGDALVNHLNHLKKFAKIPTQQFQSLPDQPTETYTHALFFSQGYLLIISNEPLSAYHDIFLRFGAVFEQTYTRFLDLQKAEAQAREAQIELALERVRARTMAMQKSDELPEISSLLFQQVKELGVTAIQNSIGIVNENTAFVELSTTIHGSHLLHTLNVPIDEQYVMAKAVAAWKAKRKSLTLEFEGQELKNYNELRNSFLETKVNFPEDHWIVNISFFSKGWLSFSTDKNVSGEIIVVLKRFAAVFEQTYTRFLDLQKAEAQAKEAHIEASLERVRSKTMAMHNSADVAETVAVMFDEVIRLGIETIRCGIGIMHEAGQMELWTAKHGDDGKIDLVIGRMDMMLHPLLKGAYESWQQKNEFYTYELLNDDLITYFNAINNHPDYPVKYDIASLPNRIMHSEFQFAEGTLFVFSLDALSAETKKIFKRFAAVFGQTYRRYLDLQKAEAQAKEAKIEASLERVRSKAMAMHSSEDLSLTVNTFFKELRALAVIPIRCGVGQVDEETRSTSLTTTTSYNQGESVGVVGKLKQTGHPILDGIFDNWKLQQEYHPVLLGPDIKAYYEVTKSQIAFPDYAEDIIQYGNFFYFKEGFVFAWTEKKLSEEELKIFQRFTSVLSLTYKRYAELKLAEAQAREAQIEAGLERVRSRTMAMQKSDELAETAAVVFKQLIGLGIEPNRLYIGTIKDESGNIEFWITDEDGTKVSTQFSGNKNDNESILKMYDGWKQQKKSISIDRQGKELENYLHYLAGELNVPFKLGLEQKRRIQTIAYFSKGFIGIASPDDQPETTTFLLERFAAVFNLTYTRFNDLQIAEAQTIEAKIEAALEKVRGRAMAMHNSSDLSSTASTVFTELRKLGIHPLRCGVGLLNKESRITQLYSASSSSEGDTLSLVGWVSLSGHTVMENIYEAWLKNEDYYPELTGEQLKLYYELLLAGLSVSVPDWKDGEKQSGHFFSISVGCLYAWSDHHYSDAEIKILKRFASIVDLTFRRYIELQKTEAGAREAVKQAALDRVRADIASMRSVQDLDRITPLIWNELTVLGIPFSRCGVFIMDDASQQIHTFLSAPDGKAVAAFHLPYDTAGNLADMIISWQQKKIYINHWDEKDFANLADTLVQQNAIANREQYMSSLPHEGIHLHFLPFLQGMLYVGNITRLSDDEIDLIQSVAAAFSTAYARYEDFNKLEVAKQQTEKTLVDLKQAQTQLIQAEKMASLGELTAGIAHEIQNPLNFVNNFSEVSNELIDEMNEEMAKGNNAEAFAIANDLKQNLVKINHHGKRADAIVKGMLQHSRINSGQKELTDINVLADEYLRLAFHGLRAKEKNFNADLKTDFDETIEKVNIIPQDIGRVLLNLYNNAFYAVNERKKQPRALNGSDDYKPLVSVTTKKTGDKVEIKIADNGSGIPQNIVNKIFQPFFTTKPTGEGTGLGLSLSYDIIKAHGGEIKVETNFDEANPDNFGKAEGTTFIIQLS